MPETFFELLASKSREVLFQEMDRVLGQEPDPGQIEKIRQLLPDSLISSSGAIVDIIMGTRKAHRLGKAHDGWWYTVKGAEQGSHPLIARHHAKRFAGCDHVVEICTGNGMDTYALANVARQITSYETDPVTAALARGNLKVSGSNNVEILVQTVDVSTDVPAFDGLWADPSRRRGDGSRTSGTAEYSPLLETLIAIAAKHPHAVVGIKCGPGDTIPERLIGDYASEYIGFDGECRERILWKNADIEPLVVSLPQQQKRWTPRDASFPVDAPPTEPTQGLLAPDALLIEPHAALIASGALDAFFHEHALVPIHRKIAYGIGSRTTTDLEALRDWAEAFTIVRVDTGVSEKRIQQNIRELGWSRRTEIKKRGWSGEPEALRRKLEFADGNVFGVIVIARTESGHLTLYVTRMT